MTPSTTWPSWSASPAPSTSPGRSRTGSCRGASPPCAGASKPISATRGPASSSRCCGSWRTPRCPQLTKSGGVGHHHRGHRIRRHRADPVPPRRATGRALQPRRPPAPQIGGHRAPRPDRLSGPHRGRVMTFPQVTSGHRVQLDVPSPLGATPQARTCQTKGATP